MLTEFFRPFEAAPMTAINVPVPETKRAGSSVIQIREQSIPAREREQQTFSLQNFHECLAKIHQEREKEEPGYPREGFLADGDAIVGQQCFLVEKPTVLELQFKLQPALFKTIAKRFEGLPTQQSAIFGANKGGDPTKIGGAKSLNLGEATIKVFSPSLSDNLKLYTSRLFAATGGFSPRLTPAADGLVSIEVQKDKLPQDPASLFRLLEDLVKQFLDIETLAPPKAEVEQREKLDCYCWNQNKTMDTLTPHEIEEATKGVQRKEVMPGYHTMVQEGRAETYLEHTPFVLTHYVAGTMNMKRCRSIVKDILRSGGLYSRMERYARGLATSIGGGATDPDMATGGGDSVFVSLRTKRTNAKPEAEASRAYFFVIDPCVTDRLDCYAYHHDSFGSKDETMLKTRDGMNDFIRKQGKKNTTSNEMMFGHGISGEHFLAITCKTEEDRSALIDELRADGINEYNGMPLEEFIVIVSDNVQDRINIGLQRRKQQEYSPSLYEKSN